jgi:AraC-like DNA-binding protein/quercetin dioxygenase-like cupin family protein
MRFSRPDKLLAGFSVIEPDDGVPELQHAGEQWVGARFRVEDHRHATWEFYLQVDGSSWWEGPGRTYEVSTGDFFAVAPGIAHQMTEAANDKHHFLFAAINLPVVLERHPDFAPLWANHDVIYRPHSEALLDPFRAIVREVSRDLPHRAAALRLALDALVLEATRLLELEQNVPDMRLLSDSHLLIHPAVAHARELLEYQPTRDWKVADLARMCGLSAGHLAHLFTTEIGVPPRQYLLRVRIERARGLLAHSDVPITQLALELGFASSQHFAAAFKQITGQSANAYRKAARGEGK